MHKKILIIDDHDLFAETLSDIFSHYSKHEVLKSELSEAKILSNITTLKIDLVILDISLPNTNGYILAQAIKKETDVKILVLSMINEPELIDALQEINVDGYLSKNTSKNELLEKVDQVLLGEKVFPELVMSLPYESSIFNLSEQELLIVKLSSEGKTSQEVSNLINRSIHTISTHKKNIIQKCNASNLQEVISKAIRFGLIQ